MMTRLERIHVRGSITKVLTKEESHDLQEVLHIQQVLHAMFIAMFDVEQGFTRHLNLFSMVSCKLQQEHFEVRLCR